MSESTQIWLALIAIVPVTIAAITSALLAWNSNQHAKQLMRVAEDTHTLVNSNMGLSLESYATVTRRLAKITKDPEDEAIADAAEKKFAEHVVQQRIVDERAESMR